MIDKSKFNTDKSPIYLEIYDKFFKEYKEKEIKLLELGIFGGGSMLLWEDYFKKGNIIGVDIEKIEIPKKSDRVKLYQGDQKDIKFLEDVCTQNAKDGFDIIIDDASHFGHETFVSFIYLFKNFLKSGGIYAIEDWGTGYWPHYNDGRKLNLDAHHISHHLHNKTDYKFEKKGLTSKGPVLNNRRFRSHDFGMVGVIKQIIDEVGICDATFPDYTGAKEQLAPQIKEVTITQGVAIIIKA